MITFFHTSDIHFGVENYGKIDPATGIHSRLIDFKKSLDRCIDQAIEADIDFFLFSGDAYKTPHPTPTHQKLLMHSFFRLQKAGIPIVIVVGNHDHPLSFGKAHALDVFSQLPLEGFYVFSKPSSQRIMTKNGPVQIVGIPWPTRNNLITHETHSNKTHTEVAAYIAQQIGIIVQTFAEQLNPNEPAILTGHLTVSNGIFSGSEKCAVYGTDPILLPSQLAIAPFDYVGLGHLHRYQDLNKNGYPALVYAGSIDRVDFGERNEEKGFCKVIIDTTDEGTKTCTHQFIPIPTRPFIQIDLTLYDETILSQTDQILAALTKENIEGAILKVVYTLAPGKQDLVDLQKVLRACEPAMAIAGIIAIHQPLAKEQRPPLKKAMHIDTLMTEYFKHKQLSPEQNEKLRQKAHQLIEKVTQHHEEEQVKP
jgi:exonuclease SbcD